MTRRLPIFATLVVLAAVATMIALGLWQLRRAEWKEGLIARYASAERLPPITWPTVLGADEQLPLFRHATGMCLRPVASRAVAGENDRGEPGYVHIVDCATGAEGPGMTAQIGWSRDPQAKWSWPGGLISGVIAPDKAHRIRLVAATPAPGLQANGAPSLQGISNNHRLYAVQWFSFAAIALLIYGLALRKRWSKEEQGK